MSCVEFDVAIKTSCKYSHYAYVSNCCEFNWLALVHEIQGYTVQRCLVIHMYKYSQRKVGILSREKKDV